jgi:hypothetical protein
MKVLDFLKQTHIHLKNEFLFSEEENQKLKNYREIKDTEFPKIRKTFTPEIFCFIDDMANRLEKDGLNKIFIHYSLNYDMSKLPDEINIELSPFHIIVISVLKQGYLENIEGELFYFYKTELDKKYSQEFKDVSIMYKDKGDQILGVRTLTEPKDFEFKQMKW